MSKRKKRTNYTESQKMAMVRDFFATGANRAAVAERYGVTQAYIYGLGKKFSEKKQQQKVETLPAPEAVKTISEPTFMIGHKTSSETSIEPSNVISLNETSRLTEENRRLKIKIKCMEEMIGRLYFQQEVQMA